MCRDLVRSLVLCMLAFAIATSSGCGKKQEIVKIGAILPLSGPASGLGNQYLHGLRLAAEELNAAPGDIRYEIVVDDGSDAARAVEAFLRQLSMHRIAAVITASEEAAVTVGARAEREFVPAFVNCNHPLVITMYRDVFRNSPSSMSLTKYALSFLCNRLGAEDIALLYADEPAIKLLAQAIKDDLRSAGKPLVASEPFDAAGADPRSSVSVIIAQKPDAIFVAGRGTAAVKVISAFRKMGYRGPISCSPELASKEILSEAASELEGCYVAIPKLHLLSELPLAERCRSQFSSEPTPNVIYAYDAIMIIAKADRYRRYEGSSLANALKKIGDYNGAAGNYSYSEREWQLPTVMVKISSGALIEVR